MKPLFFPTPLSFRKWFEQHHRTAGELLVGFYKRGSGKPSITWPESVDQALCFGWIDGVRKTIDDGRYTIRFTPRRPGSNWSAVNIKRVGELTKQGLMKKEGLAAFERRTAKKSGIYAYEQRHIAVLDAPLEAQFKANKKAWTFFQDQPPSYRHLLVYWVMSARKDETRLKRLGVLIDHSAKGRRMR